MKVALNAKQIWSLGGILAALLCLAQTGCITGATRAVPASRLPEIYKAEPRCDKVPVNFTLLRQEPPEQATCEVTARQTSQTNASQRKCTCDIAGF